MTELREYIQNLTAIDTHEHLAKEQTYTEQGPDVLCDLFENYVHADLLTAGASAEALKNLLDRSNPDIEGRWNSVRAAWAHCQHTGYGEAVRSIARDAYGMESITLDGIMAAAERNRQLRQPGERLRILRDEAGLDHVQVDDFVWACLPDESGPEFFLYDISWWHFTRAEPDMTALEAETGIAVHSTDTLREAMAGLFAKYAACAIAVKAQHAYDRTLLWQERSDAEMQPVLAKYTAGQTLNEGEKLIFGDWCLARGVELAVEHNLPFKIHTGYYAGNNRMPVERIKPGNLCGLLARYLDARFVLMHIGYPYGDEMVALAKHYPNVWVDMCWSWSIDPYAASDFVRKMIHAVPNNKLFAFGGDTSWPNAAVAYARQMRRWLSYTLHAEMKDGFMSEAQAIELATKLMRENQQACFDIEGTRASIRRALAE